MSIRGASRDALSNTSSECVVAKANEADCGAQTPKSKHVRKGGEVVLRVLNVQLFTALFLYVQKRMV